eukprot:gene8547-994_t
MQIKEDGARIRLASIYLKGELSDWAKDFIEKNPTSTFENFKESM